MTSFYPIHVSLRGKRCVVVGGGKTAERKVSTLVRYGGNVVVVSPRATPQIENLSSRHAIIWHRRRYRKSDLRGAFLLFCATGDKELNREIGREAKRRGILVNVVNSPGDSSFISPALVERGDLVLSVSTGGRVPLLSKRIRETLETMYGKEYRRYVKLIGRARGMIINNETLSGEDKRRQLARLVNLPVLSRLKGGEQVTVKNILAQLRE